LRRHVVIETRGAQSRDRVEPDGGIESDGCIEPYG
jgi:hypothetical protein